MLFFKGCIKVRFKINKMVIVKDLKCREYKNSVGISKDLWFLIVEEIIEYGKNWILVMFLRVLLLLLLINIEFYVWFF